MISTPRMWCYERFMRQCEFHEHFQYIPNTLNKINESYDWNKHNKNGYDLNVEIPELDQYVKKYMEKADRFDMNTDWDLPSKYNFTINSAHLPLAFIENEMTIKTIEYLGKLCFSGTFNDELVVFLDEMDSANLDKMEFKNTKKVMDLTQNYMNKWMRLLYHFHMWRQEQNNVVLVERNLFVALGQTKFPATTEYLKSPFRSFYLMFEPGCIVSPFSDGEKMDYEGIFINLENNNGNTILRLDLHARITKQNKKWMSSLDPVNTFWEIIIPKNINMTEGITQGIMNAQDVKSYDQDSLPWIKQNGQAEHLTNAIIQCLLYMTSVNRESVLVNMEKKTINKNRTKKYIEREETQENYHVLGSSKTNYINGGTYYSKKDGTKRTGKKLGHKTIVRGHWHSFWYKNEAKISEIPTFMHREEKYDDMGKKMIRCIKWVAPYSKGQGEEIVKEYKLTSGGRKLKETA
jgi:hypothetical protein